MVKPTLGKFAVEFELGNHFFFPTNRVGGRGGLNIAIGIGLSIHSFVRPSIRPRGAVDH